MKDNTLNRFTLKAFTAMLIFLPILVIYIVIDPFAVVRHHEPCPAFGSAIPFNKGYISTCAYIDNRDKYHYNAFIFGSSRTINFRAADWKSHLGSDASIFHFDASNETPEGIYLKMKYIDEHGDSIKYAIFEFPSIFFNDRSEYLSYRTPWQLDGIQSAPEFHYYYLNRFLDWSMFKSILKYKAYGEMPPEEIADKVLFLSTIIDGYDRSTNETYFNKRDSLYAHHPEKGKMLRFDPKLFHISKKVSTDYHRSLLHKIHEILLRHNTDYKIILGPMPDYSTLDDTDKTLIINIFGKENVSDLSRFSPAYSGKMTFYDHIHFTPEIGKEMIDSAYFCQ